MSDQDQPSKQTSSVPLKKETVRVTLKAADAPAASPTGAPPAPAAPKPTMPMAPPPAPSVPKPPTATLPPTAPAPAPTIPLRTAGAPPAPAPTIQLKTAAAPGAGSPAPTIRLATPGAATAPGGASPTLPKATVQLAPPTQPIGTAAPAMTQMATLSMGEEDEAEASSGTINVLAILGFLGAAAVVALQLTTATIWLGGPDQEGKKPAAIEWSKLF